MTDGWLRNAGRRPARGDGLRDDMFASAAPLGAAAQIGRRPGAPKQLGHRQAGLPPK